MEEVKFAAGGLGYNKLGESYSGFMVKTQPQKFPVDFSEILEQVVRQKKEIEEMFTKIKCIEDCDVMMSFERKDEEIMNDLIKKGVISEDEFI